jgi:glycosyltransferase involved in cell wall biosynthesis
MHDIHMSVAVVTRNRPTSLERTLQSLRAQDRQPWEVIVSDDSDDNQIEHVKRITDTFSCQYLRGPRRGLYSNRNHVALACRGTHIRTMDDDHEFPPRHFEYCLRAAAEDPASIWIIGEYLPTQQPMTAPPECPGQLHPRGFSVRPEDPNDCWAIADGATIYPRTVFDQGARLAEGFRFGAAYLEFGSRLHWLGYRIRQLADTFVIHHYEALNRSFSDAESDISSRFFAMLCHSFIYQPTLHNKFLSTLQIGRESLVYPGLAIPAIRAALNEYRRQLQFCATKGKQESDRLPATAESEN